MSFPKKLFLLFLIVCLTAASPLQAAAASSSSSVLSRILKSKTKRTKLKKKYSQKTIAKLTKTLQKREMTTLKNKILDYLEAHDLPEDDWSIYVKNLDSGYSFTINNRRYAAASTIKLYAMAAVYDKIKRGKLESSPALTNMIHGMITYSSNDYFNAIVADYLTPEYFNSFLKRGGYKQTHLYHGIGPSSHPYYLEPSTGGINHTSAANCGKLLEKIYKGTLVSKSASAKMLNFLKQQTFRSKIPAGIPSGITVANKTGEYENLQHDTAIVYGEKTDFIICIFSENTVMTSVTETGETVSQLPSGYVNIPHIQQISRLVYQFLN